MQKMKLTDMAAIAEIIATIALIISLIFVGYEIRDNTEESRTANRQSLATRAQELALFSARMGGGMASLNRYEELTEEQQAAARAWVPALVRNAEEAYLSYRDERLDEEYWLTRAAVVKSAIESDIGSKMYIEMKEGEQLTSDFVKALEEYIGSH